MKYNNIKKFEFHKIQIDDNEKKVYIDLSGNNDIKNFEYKGQDYILQHEYGKWMIESTLYIN